MQEAKMTYSGIDLYSNNSVVAIIDVAHGPYLDSDRAAILTEPEADLFGALRAAESIGRSFGDDRFLARIKKNGDRPRLLPRVKSCEIVVEYTPKVRHRK